MGGRVRRVDGDESADGGCGGAHGLGGRWSERLRGSEGRARGVGKDVKQRGGKVGDCGNGGVRVEEGMVRPWASVGPHMIRSTFDVTFHISRDNRWDVASQGLQTLNIYMRCLIVVQIITLSNSYCN